MPGTLAIRVTFQRLISTRVRYIYGFLMKNILERMLELAAEWLSEGEVGLLKRALDAGVDILL